MILNITARASHHYLPLSFPLIDANASQAAASHDLYSIWAQYSFGSHLLILSSTFARLFGGAAALTDFLVTPVPPCGRSFLHRNYGHSGWHMLSYWLYHQPRSITAPTTVSAPAVATLALLIVSWPDYKLSLQRLPVGLAGPGRL